MSPRSPASVFFKLCRLRQVRPLVGREKLQHSWALRSCSLDLTTASPFWQIFRDLSPNHFSEFPTLRHNLSSAWDGPFDHVSPVFKQLHWLPIEHRIQYKLVSAIALSAHQKRFTGGQSRNPVQSVVFDPFIRRPITAMRPNNKNNFYGSFNTGITIFCRHPQNDVAKRHKVKEKDSKGQTHICGEHAPSHICKSGAKSMP